jgi:transcriptional/translational regulatory protein YebC/TACO1
MAGHSKWSKVKRIKGAIDVKRGKLFSRLSKEITVAVSIVAAIPQGFPASVPPCLQPA